MAGADAGKADSDTWRADTGSGWKWRHGDVSLHTGGDLAAALGRIKAKTYVVPFSRDMFFPPADCEAEQKLIRLYAANLGARLLIRIGE